jgi:hypothetical protein
VPRRSPHRTLRQDVNRAYTHLQVPFTALRESFADRRFLVAALALNSVIVSTRLAGGSDRKLLAAAPLLMLALAAAAQDVAAGERLGLERGAGA